MGTRCALAWALSRESTWAACSSLARCHSASRVDTVYEVSLPYQVKRLVSAISIGVSFGFANIGTPLECLDLRGYRPMLLFFMTAPFAFALLIVLSAACWLAYRNEDDTRKGASGYDASMRAHPTKHIRRSALMELALPWVLRLIFIIYPIVTNIAFDAFPCFKLCFGPEDPCPASDVQEYLKADVSIQCGTPEHDEIVRLAWLAISVYPIGLLGVIAFLLWRAQHAIGANRRTDSRPSTALSRAITFLYKEYSPGMFWCSSRCGGTSPCLIFLSPSLTISRLPRRWELVEMLRRLVLVGLMVLASGSQLQLIIGAQTLLAPLCHRAASRLIVRHRHTAH